MASVKRGKKRTKKHVKSDGEDVSPDAGPQLLDPPRREGILHLIECSCVLPQYLKRDNPIFHKFIVFSIIEADGMFQHSVVQCNNCGIMHRVTDVSSSEVMYGHEDGRGRLTIDDLRYMLPHAIVDVLEANDCPPYVWEQAKFIVDEERWGDHVILTADEMDGHRHGKFMTIAGPDKLGIAQYDTVVEFPRRGTQ